MHTLRGHTALCQRSRGAHGEVGSNGRADACPARLPVALLGPRGGTLHGRATAQAAKAATPHKASAASMVSLWGPLPERSLWVRCELRGHASKVSLWGPLPEHMHGQRLCRSGGHPRPGRQRPLARKLQAKRIGSLGLVPTRPAWALEANGHRLKLGGAEPYWARQPSAGRRQGRPGGGCSHSGSRGPALPAV